MNRLRLILLPVLFAVGLRACAPVACAQTKAVTVNPSTGALVSPNAATFKSANGIPAQRTITAGTGISVTNGDGVAGNPTIALSAPVLPSFSAYKITTTDAQTVTSGAGFTRVTFSGEAYDVGSGFTGSIWTPGVAGKVRVNTSVRFTASGGGTGVVSCYFRVNDAFDGTSRLVRDLSDVSSGVTASLSGTAVFSVGATDTVSVWISTEFNSIILTDQAYTTYFQGELIANP